MKKLFSLVLIFTMCFTSAVYAVDTADATANAENEYLQAILNEIKVQGGYTDEEMATAEIISGNSVTQARAYGTASPLIEDAALKIETVENNMIKQDIIVPQTLTEDGEFINLLALSYEKLKEHQTHPSVNISNNTIIMYNSFYFGFEVSNLDSEWYIQPFGQSCRWTSNNPNAIVTGMELHFRVIGLECTWERVGHSSGDIYGYPTEQGDVSIDKLLFKYYPVKDQVYNDWSIMFPDNFCVRLRNHASTGDDGATGWGIYDYTINGVSGTEVTPIWNIKTK